MKRLFYPPPIRRLMLMVIMLLVAGNTFLFAEGSIDFRNYPGHRLFYNVEQEQQLKVYANAGEFINVGSSHVGVNGGTIEVYNPNGVLVATFGGTDNVAIIFDNVQEENGPTGTAENGYIPGVVSVPVGQAGVWSVRLRYPTPSAEAFVSDLLNSDPWERSVHQPNTSSFDQRVALAWDVTVTQGGAGNNGGTGVSGRLYSNEYVSILDFNGRSTSPTFYILTEFGYLYKVDFSDTDPWGFPIHSNNLGLVTGDIVPIYMSANIGADVSIGNTVGNFTRSLDTSTWNANENYLYEPQAQDLGAISNNKIFFNPPDPTLPAFGTVTDLNVANTHTTWLYNQVSGVDEAGKPFTFFGILPENGSCQGELIAEEGAGGYFVFRTDLAGQAFFKMDVNNNGSFDDAVDVSIHDNIGLGIDSIFWDGRDGEGNVIGANPNFQFGYDLRIRGGEVHLLLADIENNPGGVVYTRLNGPNSPDSSFYYDHSSIGGGVSGGGTPGSPLITNTAYTYTDDFGNEKMLDQWTFIETNSFGTGSLVISVESECSPGDHDNDGIPDIVDIDDDNDGVPDLLEFCHPTGGYACLPNGIDPSGDNDGDGIQNFEDANDPAVMNICNDTDGNGICDQLLTVYDTDGDGVPDHFDLDSDNDGLSDLVEAGHGQPDADGNGVIDGPNSVFGANGFYVSLESSDGQDAVANYSPWDFDGDGIPDHDDLDSDNDGILDVVEAGYASSDSNQDGRIDDGNGNIPTVNADGLAPLIDPAITGVGIPLPIDWDSDGVPDWHDLDSDNDGILDVIEGGYQGNDTNGDGRIDDGNGNVPTVNSDGLPPVMDPALTGTVITLPPDTDNDGIRDWHDLDSDNDGINDTVENKNVDGDGDGFIGTGPITVDANGIATADANGNITLFVPLVNTDGTDAADFRDLDADGDGINDVIESGIANADPDGNGLIGTGLPTVNPFGQATDGAISNPLDSDGNGTPDFQEVTEPNCEAPTVPTLSASGTSLCAGENLTLTATGVTDPDVTYIWTANSTSGVSEFTTNDPTFTLSQLDISNTATYTVVARKDTCSSAASAGIAILVSPVAAAPTLTASATSACEGDAISLSAGAAAANTTYQWTLTAADGSSSIVATTTDPTLSLNPFTAVQAGSYTVETIGGVGACSNGGVSNSIAISVAANPATPNLTATANTACEGESITLNGGTAAANTTYQWTLIAADGSSSVVATTNDPTLTLNPIAANQAGTYAVEAIIGSCSSGLSNTVAIGVTPRPAALVLTTSAVGACEGEAVTLSATPAGDANTTYQWTLIAADGSSSVVATTNDPTLTLNPIAANQAGTYSVEALDPAGACPSGPSNGVAIAVSSKPTAPELTVDKLIHCVGDRVEFTASEVLGDNVTYMFMFTNTDGREDQLITNAQGVLVIENLSSGNTGTYQVIAIVDGCASDPSNGQLIDVASGGLTDIDVTSSSPANNPSCEGDNVTLSATPLLDGATYEWSGPDGVIGNTAEIVIPNATPADNGEYTLVITNNSCPISLGPVTVEVASKPTTPTIASDKDSACPGESVTLTTPAATGNNITYDWILNGTVVANTTDPTYTDQNFQGTDARNYTVVVKDGACASDASEPATVSLKESLDGVTVSSNSPVCIGDPINLTVTDVDGATFEWSGPDGFSSSEQNPTVVDSATTANAGDYTVVVTVDGCPANIPTATVEVTPKPDAPVVSISEGPVCEGIPATITVTDVQANTTYTVLDAAGNTVTTGTEGTIEIPTDGAAGDNTYTVIAQQEGGCPSEQSNGVNLSVTPKPDEEAMILTDPMSDNDCGSTPGTVEAAVPTQGTGMWSSSNEDVVFTDASNPTTEVMGLEDGDVVTWTLTNETCGEYGTTSITISTMQPETIAGPDGSIILSTETATGNVANNDTPSDGEVTVISGPANGVGSIDANGNYTYTPNEGFVGSDQIVYEICNTACPNAPCAQGTLTITVNQDPSVLDCVVPDVISPNSDGLNDVFVIGCSDFKTVALKIFNRWGDLVYESDNYNNNWAGTHDGNDLPPGPYYFIFEEDGVEAKTGCVSIAR